MTKETITKLSIAVVLILAAVISFLPVASITAKPETYAETIASIDDKTETVLKLTATCTVASAAISAIPDDTATPIAEKLADFTEYFLLILCTLYAEKYMLTIIGTGTFQFLIPAACLMMVFGLLREHKTVKQLALKFFLFGLAIFLAVPLSVKASDLVYDTYRESIEATISSAEDFSQEAGESTPAPSGEGLLSSIVGKLTEKASQLTNRAAGVLNSFIESLAVMIVTSCIIPLLVLFFFLWIAKSLTGMELTLPKHRHKAESK